MKVAVIYNKPEIDDSDVINVFGMKNRECYSPDIIELVASSLEKGGHNVRIIEGNMHVIEELQAFMPKVVRGEHPGMVFNMAYGIQGQSRYTHIPSMLEMLGIPYVGSGPNGHAIALDKVLSKIVFLRHNLPTPAFWMFSDPKEDMSQVTYPAIVKPRMEAVSFGIRLVDNRKDLRKAVSIVTKEFKQQALVEGFVPGREFGVSLLGNEPVLDTLPIVEIDFEGDENRVQTPDDKMRRPLNKICPADLPRETGEELSVLARKAFNSLGLCDFARVDFRMDPAGRLQILEINSMASLNNTGSFVHAAQMAGLEYAELVNRIQEIAALRYFGDSQSNGTKNDVPTMKKSIQLHVRAQSYLRSNLSTIVKHLERMVAMNSYVRNREGVNMLGDWVSDRFKQLRFKRQMFPQAEVGNLLYFTNHNQERNDILLLGHLDTVYDYDNEVPFSEDRVWILGSGVAESKGGIAIILAALEALKSSRALKNVKVGVLFTPDDTIGGGFSRSMIEEIARRSNYVLGTKYSDLQGGIVTSCSGAQQYSIDITRVVNGNRNEKKHATDLIELISRKSLSWMKLSSPKRGLELKVSSLTAQTNSGRSSDRASIVLDLTFSRKSQFKKTDELIREITEKGANEDVQIRLRSGELRQPFPYTKANRQFFMKVQSLAGMLEVHVEPAHRDVTSGICHVPENVPVLGGFGPIGGKCRSQSEFIVRDSLIDRAALLALVIQDCSS